MGRILSVHAHRRPRIWRPADGRSAGGGCHAIPATDPALARPRATTGATLAQGAVRRHLQLGYSVCLLHLRVAEHQHRTVGHPQCQRAAVWRVGGLALAGGPFHALLNPPTSILVSELFYFLAVEKEKWS